jgi:hypothetical protein
MAFAPSAEFVRRQQEVEYLNGRNTQDACLYSVGTAGHVPVAVARGDYNNPYHGLRSPPLKLYWGGWEANSVVLQRNGWIFEMYRSERTFVDIVTFHHPLSKVYCQFQVDDVWRQMGQGDYLHHAIPIQAKMAGDIVMHWTPEMSVNNFTRLDMEPSYEYTYISKLNLFREWHTPETKKIILPQEENIDMLLKSILDKQQPAQVEYFENKVRNKEVLNIKQSAQIIQLAA